MGARNFAFGATAGCDCDSQLMLGLTPRSIVENHLSNRHTEFHQEVLLLRSSLHATQSLLAKVWKLLDPTWEPLRGVCFVAGRCIAIQSWSECGIWSHFRTLFSHFDFYYVSYLILRSSILNMFYPTETFLGFWAKIWNVSNMEWKLGLTKFVWLVLVEPRRYTCQRLT